MRVLIFSDETGGGWMRRAQPAESLADFIRECQADEGRMDSMTYGRWLPDPDDPDWERIPCDPQPRDAAELTEAFGGYAADNDDPRLTVLEAAEDGEYVLMWILAEVPDWTRYIYNGGCHRDLERYCGIGGSGYIALEGP